MILHLKVKPGSKVDQLFYDDAGPGSSGASHDRPGHDRQLHAKIKAPAQDGKANAYLIEFLAKQFGVAKSRITIVAGFTNPHKRVDIDADDETIQVILQKLLEL